VRRPAVAGSLDGDDQSAVAGHRAARDRLRRAELGVEQHGGRLAREGRGRPQLEFGQLGIADFSRGVRAHRLAKVVAVVEREQREGAARVRALAQPAELADGELARRGHAIR
jgi:hypothetical protein